LANSIADLKQFERIHSIRPTDRARMDAQRIVINVDMPIRWTFIATDRLGKSLFAAPVIGKEQAQYKTSELASIAQKNGFVDWQVTSEETIPVPFDALDDKSTREMLMQKQPLPDPTLYLVD
jgi:hypothetical protein